MWTRSPLRAGLELAGVWTLLEVALWVPEGPYLVVTRALAGGLILATVGVSFQRRRGHVSPNAALPLQRSPMLRAWFRALAATALAAALVITTAWLLGLWKGGLHFGFAAISAEEATSWWAGKLAAVTAQQLALQLFALPLCVEILGLSWTAMALAGLIFGAAHLPNVPLAVLSGGFAPVWCFLYLRSRRLLPLVASHLLLALVVRAACGDLIFNMRVGAGVLPLLPRTLVAAEGEELRVWPKIIQGFVDLCAVEGARAVCLGWSADTDRGSIPESIVVMAHRELHRYPMTGLSRPDVAAHFEQAPIKDCGFRLDLPADWFGASTPIRFFGEDANGRSSELQYGPGYPWRPKPER